MSTLQFVFSVIVVFSLPYLAAELILQQGERLLLWFTRPRPNVRKAHSPQPAKPLNAFLFLSGGAIRKVSRCR